MPQLDAIGIVTADMAKARRFYGLLGLDFPENDEDHVEATTPNGLRVMLDKLELMKKLDTEWVPPVGHRMGIRDIPADYAEFER